MRPDRVYATGVIDPVGGYDPVQDVMAVAQQFTTGPYYFSQGNGVLGAPAFEPVLASQYARRSQLLGLAASNPAVGFLQRLKYRVQAAIAGSKARKFMAASAARMGGGMSGGAPNVAMPASSAGPRIAPAAYSRLQMLMTMAQANQPSDWGAYNTDVVMQRFANLRQATR